MDVNYVVKCVEVMKELSKEEKDYLIDFLNDNKDEIDVDYTLHKGGSYGENYYEFSLCGPDQFYMHFEVGCISSYLALLELSDEYGLHTYSTSCNEEPSDDEEDE